jgi:hypothetical protein
MMATRAILSFILIHPLLISCESRSLKMNRIVLALPVPMVYVHVAAELAGSLHHNHRYLLLHLDRVSIAMTTCLQ